MLSSTRARDAAALWAMQISSQKYLENEIIESRISKIVVGQVAVYHRDDAVAVTHGARSICHLKNPLHICAMGISAVSQNVKKMREVRKAIFTDNALYVMELPSPTSRSWRRSWGLQTDASFVQKIENSFGTRRIPMQSTFEVRKKMILHYY